MYAVLWTRLDAPLRVLAALLLVIAVGALLWPPSVPDTMMPPAGLDSLPAGLAPEFRDDAFAATIVRANVFSDSRSPPAVRYDPYQPEPDPAMMVDAGVGTDEVAEATAVPQLFGIVSGPAGRRALMRLEAALPEAQLYGEGDRAGGFRVVRINAESVVLDTSEGRVVLRLTRSEASAP